MSEWFERNDGRYINLDHVARVVPESTTTITYLDVIFGDGEKKSIYDVDDVSRLQQHLHKLAQVATANLTPPPTIVKCCKEEQ